MLFMKPRVPPRIADDNDFQEIKKLIDCHDGWTLELDKANTQVWTRSIPNCDFNMVKILSEFDDCSADVMFDVLHDPDYRKEWDSHMLASEEIGIVNVNNDVGYYAMSCPPPLKPRDFVLMRSWLDTGPRGEQMLLSRSVPHKDFPPRKGYVRAQSHITGFIMRSLPNGGCFLGYVAHCDPQGHLPSWLVNKVTHTLGPRMVKDLRRAAMGYVTWKRNQSHGKKPWRFPEEMCVPRIILEKDCIDPLDYASTLTPSSTASRTLTELGVKLPSTPQQNSKFVIPVPSAAQKSISAPSTPMHDQLLLNSEKQNGKFGTKPPIGKSGMKLPFEKSDIKSPSESSSIEPPTENSGIKPPTSRKIEKFFARRSGKKLDKSVSSTSLDSKSASSLDTNSDEGLEKKSSRHKFKTNLLSFKKKKKILESKT